MRRILSAAALVTILTWVAWAADAPKELEAAAQVLQNMTSSNHIPSSVLGQSRCIAVIPRLTKGGLIVGGEHGNGVVSCRTKGGWSAPAFITVTGGSLGLQAGGEHQDIVLAMNSQGEQELRNGHWDLGAEAVATGPSGESTERSQSTGWKAPVLSYTQSSGAYAGANLEGSKINADEDLIHNVYGANATFQSVLAGQVSATPAAQQFMSALQRVTGR